MTHIAGNSTVNIALFVIQIVSAASGFVIAASCLFLRKWHPPVAYTAAFHISFWIGVQAMITHTGSAISVRLPESSENMQKNKPLVRFLVWAQFAMPLWFVFLNATIATDLMLSQLFRLSSNKLQAVHKWYLPVATSISFTLALPLLIYHSAYRPETNVFSVQFPSALSVALYYILAFDVWLAVGIVYCFVVVSLVVGVLLVKLRRKRAAWNHQNENNWFALTPTEQKPKSAPVPHTQQQTDQTMLEAGNGALCRDKSIEYVTQNRVDIECATPDIKEKCNGESDSHIDPDHVRTFAQSSQLPLSSPSPLPVKALRWSRVSTKSDTPQKHVAVSMLRKPINTLISGVTFSKEDIKRTNSTSVFSKPSPDVTDCNHIPLYKQSHPFRTSVQSMGYILTKPFRDPAKNLNLILQSSKINPGTHSNPELVRQELRSSRQRKTYFSSHKYVSADTDCSNVQHERISEQLTMRESTSARPQKNLLSLGKLPPQPILRYRNRTLLSSHPSNSPFRIPTLALFRLLLYPLIPIFSFTLMCVVRWVWFRSAMPSRWEILNVLSGFLRALEGFLCLIVFLLNPALNRSFREIRKRNTPVFT